MSDASESSNGGAPKETRQFPSEERPPERGGNLAGSEPGSNASTPVERNFPGQAVGYYADGGRRQESRNGGSPINQSPQGSHGFLSSAASEAGGPEDGRGGVRSIPNLPPIDVKQMPDWIERNGEVLMGKGIEPCPPFFKHGSASGNGWVPYRVAEAGFDAFPFIPVRAMCVNIPAECFTNDASKFVDWTTPSTNSARPSSIAAVLGLISTPLTKGWLSGAHEEVARLEATVRPGDDQNGVHGEAEVKKPKRVNRYMTQSENDPQKNAPMVVIGYEDIYDTEKATVLAIRVWHFVFDKSHSTSELARKLMDENCDESDHSGAAHQQNSLRKQTVVAAAKASRGLVGASIETAKLETSAGMVYRHITNESVYKNMLPHYAGRSDKGAGRPPVDLESLPRGALNRRLYADPHIGCEHPLALEWVFNAKRPDGLAAGLVHLDGTLMDVHPDQIQVDSYFDITVPKAQANKVVQGKDVPGEGDSHAFRVPDWVAADESNQGRRCFFFQTDPNQLNIFDMSLPHAIVGAMKPGPTLQSLFKQTVLKLPEDAPAYPVGGSALLNRFNNEMTGRDQWEAEAINAMADSMVGFDTFDCTPDQRLDARTAKRNAARGLACYGQKDGDDHVIEPRQALKEHAFTTTAVHRKIIAPWAAEQRLSIEKEEYDLRIANNYEHADTKIENPVFASVNEKTSKFRTTHAEAIQELVTLHIAKMESSFSSAFERESIPIGYRAVYDGLQEELRHMHDGTANLAVAHDIQLTDSGRTVFGTLLNWIGIFFEDDCYVDGRSWGLMQELFFHCFEQFDEQTLLLIFCGPKGNGKTLRTERAQKAFVDGWIVMSGPSSAKSGMQGNSDSCNGCNCVYDEMIDELTAGDGDARIEYWKQILLKREFNYMKAVVVRGADGREMHRTYKLRTPHQETHVVCTNRGPAFTRGSEEPSDGKQALLDRSVVLFVRTEGKKTHDDAEFETNMSHPQVRTKVRTFRILTCLTGLLKMLIFRQPFMRPDTALAQKMWDHWDERLDCKFGLPRPSPRKNVKRLSNLTTMCCLNAVAHVFMYKQTVLHHKAGETTERHPNGLPFKMSMLAQCVPLLQPTPEMIHAAWTMGLEYNIGTSAMGMCGMSIIAEAAGRKVGDWMTRLPTEEFHSYLMRDSELEGHAAANDPSLRRPWNPPSTNNKLPELEKLFDGVHTVTIEDCRRLREQLRKKREMREEYKRACSRGEMQNAVLRDPARMIADALVRSTPDTVIDSIDIDDDDCAVDAAAEAAASSAASRPSGRLTGSPRGKALYNEGVVELSEVDDNDGDVQRGFHCERAIDFPGAAHCALEHEDTSEHRMRCPYCCTSQEDNDASEIVGAVVSTRLSREVSCIWPDAMEACMFYKPQVLVQWAAGSPAFMEPGLGGSVVLGTRASGSLFGHKKRGNGPSGAQRLDVAWLASTEGDWAKSWRKTADYFKNQKSHTIDMFDVHRDGLGELLWLLSTKDNSRRIADEPRLMASARPENCVLNTEDKRVADSDVIVKMAPFSDPRQGETGIVGSSANPSPPEHLPRDEHSLVMDTEWQRRLDTLLHAGRLAALNPLISNRVVVSPPIRMNPESGLEVNVGAVHAHTMLLAESVLACATMPGLRNAQEPFCNGQSGPEGLSADRVARGRRRGGLDADSVQMLPYSYDVISIAIAEDAALMLYGDKGSQQLENLKKKNPKINLTFEQLPHLSLRYLGYSEYNRQTLSIKLGATRRDGQPYIEAGDPSINESRISEAHVRRSLGREVSCHAEMASYIGRKQGARSMGSVKGDLFASSTWYQHCIKSLQARGLVGPSDEEPAVKAYGDMTTCIGMRIREDRCVSGNPKYAAYKLTKAVPGTYDALEDVEDEAPRDQKRNRTDVPTQAIASTGHAEDDLAGLRDLLEDPSSEVIAMDAAPHPE